MPCWIAQGGRGAALALYPARCWMSSAALTGSRDSVKGGLGGLPFTLLLLPPEESSRECGAYCTINSRPSVQGEVPCVLPSPRLSSLVSSP